METPATEAPAKENEETATVVDVPAAESTEAVAQ